MKRFTVYCQRYHRSVQNHSFRLFMICVVGLTTGVLVARSNILSVGIDRHINFNDLHNRLLAFVTYDYTRSRSHNYYMSRALISTKNPQNCTDDFRNRHLMTVEYKGRVGNHMFRFASLLAVTALTCFKPVWDPRFFRIDDIFEVQNIEKINVKMYSKYIREPGWGIYDQNITSKVSPNFNWTLGGYRQSYRYFQNHSDFVRTSFRFKTNIMRDVSLFLWNGTIKHRPKVCLHVRRWDLTTRSLKDGRIPVGMDFINRAVAYISKYLKPSNFWLIIITDDKLWCKQNIKGDNIVPSPFKDAGRDLCLLTQCDHNIVTAGSFGWMGAWLNETGVVIYNKMFPTPNSTLAKRFKKEDYYPSNWVGL